ncbi:MAG: class I SAM-dependent methyltransferase [Cyanobacteria bacterium P01_F01_bin.150]
MNMIHENDMVHENDMAHENEYIEIVDYYDDVLTSGYYDFDALSHSLHQLLGTRRKILDIGVGTGLLAEKMIHLEAYKIVGVDFSSRMLERAKNRLADSDVNLIHKDITEFTTEDTFDAIVSSGGAIYVVEEEGEYRIYSHITDKQKNEQLIGKLHRQLNKDGILALAIQGSHNNYKKKIKDDLIYEQRVIKHGSYVDKWYTFSRSNGKVLTEQFCRFLFFDGQQTDQLLDDAGFSPKREVVDAKFWTSYK